MQELAIRKNNDLYGEILENTDTISVRAPTIWYCLEKTLPLYSNIVTISDK